MSQPDRQPVLAKEPRWPSLLLILFVAGAVFATRTAPWWRGGELLAGDHADGPFHFAGELVRPTAGTFPTDPMVQANSSLGAYEQFYASVICFGKFTGWSLLTTILAMCWMANLLYLVGVFVLLRKLQVAPWAGARGTWLAAQPFVFIGMASGVTHSLAIPREVWLWPLPWWISRLDQGQFTRTKGQLQRPLHSVTTGGPRGGSPKRSRVSNLSCASAASSRHHTANS